MGFEPIPAILMATADVHCRGREFSTSAYQVIPSGRATRALRHCFAAAPAEKFRNRRCWGDLNDTSHFHIDYHGDLFTGLCVGLAPASVFLTPFRCSAVSPPPRQRPLELLRVACADAAALAAH